MEPFLLFLRAFSAHPTGIESRVAIDNIESKAHRTLTCDSRHGYTLKGQ